jgi:hypothetical protein
MARYMQDSDTPLAVGQVESDYPSQAVTHDPASRISRPCSETSVQTMSIGRTGPHEREPVSSGAIPWRYSIGQPHPVVETQAAPECRFGKRAGGERIPACRQAPLGAPHPRPRGTGCGLRTGGAHLLRRAYIAGTAAGRSHRAARPRGAETVSELGDGGRQELHHPGHRAHRVSFAVESV